MPLPPIAHEHNTHIHTATKTHNAHKHNNTHTTSNTRVQYTHTHTSTKINILAYTHTSKHARTMLTLFTRTCCDPFVPLPIRAHLIHPMRMEPLNWSSMSPSSILSSLLRFAFRRGSSTLTCTSRQIAPWAPIHPQSLPPIPSASHFPAPPSTVFLGAPLESFVLRLRLVLRIDSATPVISAVYPQAAPLFPASLLALLPPLRLLRPLSDW